MPVRIVSWGVFVAGCRKAALAIWRNWRLQAYIYPESMAYLLGADPNPANWRGYLTPRVGCSRTSRP